MTTTNRSATPEARAAYMRAWRSANPDKNTRAYQIADARRRALRRLVELHPDDMQRLYDAERQAAGL